MTVLRAGAIVLTATGILGYVAGLFVEYTGRAFALTAVMVGISLFMIAPANRGAGP